MKFIIETYGCQMNVADSEMISSILTNSGHELTEDITEAEIIIFNTCSVRQHAEDRVLGRISNEIKRKYENPNVLIGVVGCMAQRMGKDLKKLNKKIDFVVGVDNYFNLPQIIENLQEHSHFVNDTVMNHQEIYSDIYPIRSDENNAFITIMRGCNNFCTYCIVPYVRGRERSRPARDILEEVRKAGESGLFDVTLLGQNVNSYQWEDMKFPDLLRKINEIETIKRIRFITSHPKDLSDDLIKAMAECSKVCEHIHLPVQSGNNEVLKTMNRGYTREHYLNLISKLREAIPHISVTTDVIAGFPGETDEQFEETFELMKSVRFDFAFMFKYSTRTGTAAEKFENQVPEETRLERLQRLIDLQTQITHEKYKEQVGKTVEVYVEGVSKKDTEEICGKTRDFKIVVFKGKEDLIHQFITVKIVDAVGWTLKGEII